MTALKFDKYTLWVKWLNRGWQPLITCLTLPWPAENPRRVLKSFAEKDFLQYWDRKDWMILGGDKKPAGKEENAADN